MKCSDRMCGADDCERCHPENAWPSPYNREDNEEPIHHPDFKVDCHACGGHGWFWNLSIEEPKQIQCESCNGTGSITPTEAGDSDETFPASPLGS